MSATPNPYSPPRAHVDDVGPTTPEAEEIRHEYIKHEASVRTVGILYYTSGGLMSFLGIIYTSDSLLSGTTGLQMNGSGVELLAIGVLLLFVAPGIRKLRPWARKTTIVLAAIGLFKFPLVTVINGNILYLMLARQGRRIFEDDYANIIATTPHLNYRTSIIVWIALGLLLLALLGVFVIATLETMH